ncbi:DUF5124 domain-containing protein [Mucilaginibacter sp. SMC90]|uniref:DUF5008 domain-containing protein n=1 Tax=Mucilaginibacter sp. SMC90 TaxID=2929803 RepID=UPI001FB2EF91|nr:DUF5008 domain-containing protein [Mucilaginibacter sp. SMC90]UOE47786.1 DUF5124 domain-containing protein [Mucilaginibacter sp. SMC90]
MKLLKVIYYIVLFNFLIGGLLSCKKKEVVGPDPYAGGKVPFGVKFAEAQPLPSSGPAGSSVIFKVQGLKSYEGKFDFQISNESTKVLDLSDSTITVEIPDNISSGIASIKLGGQIFFGPRFTVTGNVSIDAGFAANLGVGTDLPINAAYEYNQGYLLVGSFLKINTQNVNHIGFINYQGTPSTNYASYTGANGSLLSVARLASGKFIIGGSFTGFTGRSGIGNITRLNSDGSLDVMYVNVINQTPDVPNNGLDTVPAFNAAVPNQNIIKTFVTSDNKVIAVGAISYYSTISYAQSTRLGRFYIYKPIHTIMRTDENGVLDSTYNYGPQNTGADALVNDAYLQPDDKVVLVGNFTKYNGTKVGSIVRLDGNGNVDATFLAGAGANGKINTVQYNPLMHRVMITGNFTAYDGVACPGIAMLKDNGDLDKSFLFGAATGGEVNFARMLNNGKVLVSGTFTMYNNVSRPGFLLLNGDGSALQTFNHVGTFEGQIQQVIETTSTAGNPAVILLGLIHKFDDQTVNNIVKVEIKN